MFLDYVLTLISVYYDSILCCDVSTTTSFLAYQTLPRSPFLGLVLCKEEIVQTKVVSWCTLGKFTVSKSPSRFLWDQDYPLKTKVHRGPFDFNGRY